ncbi:MAG: fibrillarin-like rRNA/tRNA 2'-O-methyltransferase [Candidatus Lokiarchaeota archaeon]|nr:fibrillarin-like rRNA/tRNA 2'-O-methyltransferase [Candidatus Lokiarchaeota archaeon]
MNNIKIRKHPKIYNVFISGPLSNPRLYTRNLVPGRKIYDEKLIKSEGIEYRSWDPERSKLAAIFINDPSTNFLKKGIKCLYLGAASGTTVSHLSDILPNGIIYAVEFAERSMRQLIQNTSDRKNIIPILADARHPVEFANTIFTDIDLIYQDVAQPTQAEISVKNGDYYLKEKGKLILVIKSQSIDSVSKSEQVYKEEKKFLEESGYSIQESINIHNFAKNHIVLISEK